MTLLGVSEIALPKTLHIHRQPRSKNFANRLIILRILLAVVALLNGGLQAYNLRGSRARQAWATSPFSIIVREERKFRIWFQRTWSTKIWVFAHGIAPSKDDAVRRRVLNAHRTFSFAVFPKRLSPGLRKPKKQQALVAQGIEHCFPNSLENQENTVFTA